MKRNIKSLAVVLAGVAAGQSQSTGTTPNGWDQVEGNPEPSVEINAAEFSEATVEPEPTDARAKAINALGATARAWKASLDGLVTAMKGFQGATKSVAEAIRDAQKAGINRAEITACFLSFGIKPNTVNQAIARAMRKGDMVEFRLRVRAEKPQSETEFDWADFADLWTEDSAPADEGKEGEGEGEPKKSPSKLKTGKRAKLADPDEFAKRLIKLAKSRQKATVWLEKVRSAIERIDPVIAVGSNGG
jgi:hypothetical protein